MELVILTIAISALIVNFTLRNNDNYTNQSVVFSFLKTHPGINSPLLAQSQTSVIRSIDTLVSRATAQSSYGIILAQAGTDRASTDQTTIQENVALKPNPADTQNFSRHGLTTYTVSSGDTISEIASGFGISPATIMTENKLNEISVLKPGQELTILPTTGITHTLTDNETMESIISKYKISEDDFLDANNIESFDDLEPGAIVVLPLSNVAVPQLPKIASKFVKDESGKVALRQATAPADLIAAGLSFIWPTTIRTITQGFSKRHSGIDISDSKMKPIMASAAGFVEISGYQTNGYGNTIVINHGNGYKTRYGHASELYVSAGDHVAQGQVIAKQGHSGRVRGVTGIHLHFEIIKNGAKINPLSYVRP